MFTFTLPLLYGSRKTNAPTGYGSAQAISWAIGLAVRPITLVLEPETRDYNRPIVVVML